MCYDTHLSYAQRDVAAANAARAGMDILEGLI
jgi:hypothetical protein